MMKRLESSALRGGVTLAVLALAACAGNGNDTPSEDQASDPEVIEIPDVEDRVQVWEGFAGPESVRYDPDQDVWFVANFNGAGGERDANGFISRVSAETGRSAPAMTAGPASAQ